MSTTYRFALNTELDMFCTWLEDSTRRVYREGSVSPDGSFLMIQNMQRKQLQSRTVCEFAAVYHPPGGGRVAKYIGRAFQFELLPSTHPNVVEVVASLVRPDAATGYANVLRMITDAYPEVFEKSPG